jgi:hypothetical protein
MKTKQRGIFLAVIYFMAFLLTNNVANAQEAKKEGYQRSSLHIINIENLKFDNAAKVNDAYLKYEFPKNYDQHDIGMNVINLDNFKLSDEEKAALGIKESELGKGLSSMISSATAGIIENNSQVRYELDKFIKEQGVGKKLVQKWFSINPDGTYSFDLFNKRGESSLTEEDKKRMESAALSQTEKDKLAENLAKNTFVVFTKLNFVSNAIPAEAIRQVAYAQADKLSGMLQTIARKAADKIYEKASEGYSVWTSAWLYRLAWNEEKYSEFKTALKLKGDMSSSIDMDLFNKIDFPLEFIGQEKATSLVTFSLKKGEAERTEDQIIELSTIRNIDKVFSKLQREYEVFQPLYQLSSVDPFAAKLGTKEGLEGGEKFEILEIKNGQYNRIDVITVDKSKIWDNSFGAPKQDIEQTYFKGKNKDAREWFYVRYIK